MNTSSAGSTSSLTAEQRTWLARNRRGIAWSIAAVEVVGLLIFGSRRYHAVGRQIAAADTAVYFHDRSSTLFGPWRARFGALRILTKRARIEKGDGALPTYIARFRDGRAPQGHSAEARFARELARVTGIKLRFIYHDVIDGFAFEGLPEVAQLLSDDPRIASVTPDLRGGLTGKQKPARWNLDRLDEPAADHDNAFDFDGDGAGIDVYLLDSGVLPFHRDLEDDAGHFRVQALEGGDLVGDGTLPGRCNDHGTQMAGIIAGRRFGIAKSAFIRSIRVAQCSNKVTGSAVIQGLQLAVRDHAARTRRPAVVNLSLEFFAKDKNAKPLLDAIAKARQEGLIVVAAAGNDYGNACDIVPASDSTVITVGAADRGDGVTAESNRGECVKVFAPGSEIVSSSNRTDTAFVEGHGTSQAAAHVSGVLALWLSLHPSASAADAETFIRRATGARIRGDRSTRSPWLVQSRFEAPNILSRAFGNVLDKAAGVITGRP